MFKVSVVGIDQFVKNTRDFASEFVNTDQEIRAACFNTIVLISDRVQQRGETTDGTKMRSKSKDVSGSYSFDYGKYQRFNKGFQIDHVDLTYTGEMMDSLTLEPQGGGNWSVGFAGQSASDKAEFNEQYYGTIFQLSESEYNDVMDDLLNNIQKKIDAAY